jgi:hypothetical protein
MNNKCLVFHSGVYKYYTSLWNTIGTTVLESDYLTIGMNDISVIPETAWKQLMGTVELSYYTDVIKTEAQFNIETNPFTLADEWADKTSISIIEYTDNPTQTESATTIEIDPISFYDEMGNNFDVLYYTDDTSKTSTDLELNALYTPLDEISTDFDVVVYALNEQVLAESSNINYQGLPIAQLILHTNDLEHYGDIQQIVASKITTVYPEGIMKFIISFDSGVTWKAYRHNKWQNIYTNGVTNDINIASQTAMTLNEINAIPTSELVNNTTLRLGYFLDESKLITQETKIGMVKAISKENLNDVKFNNLAFYLLNTTATINLTFSGSKISGVLDDVDKTRVRYRVKLNGIPYFPADGGFSSLQDAPYNIKLVIDDRKVRFGEQNSLIVEFQDSWGQTDSWQTTFVGNYSGLLFTDEVGSFYTTGFGEVLKNLDFGQIIAGQTTLDRKVVLLNRMGYDLKNVRLQVIQPQLSGVAMEISKEQSPFIALEALDYPEVLMAEGTIEFYVRVSTILTAQESPSGKFEIRVNADKVI